jgi:hypothetical protein
MHCLNPLPVPKIHSQVFDLAGISVSPRETLCQKLNSMFRR